jgi:hypothetical protein
MLSRMLNLLRIWRMAIVEIRHHDAVMTWMRPLPPKVA